MLLNKALKKAKRSDGEKVGLNIKVPIEMKKEFDKACKSHDTSMTAMMLALIETFVEESQGNFDPIELELIRLAKLRLHYLDDHIETLRHDLDPDNIQEYETMITERTKLKFMLEEIQNDSNN